MSACFIANVDLVKTLVEHHAEVNAQDQKGATALMYTSLSVYLEQEALANQSTEVLELAIEMTEEVSAYFDALIG